MLAAYQAFEVTPYLGDMGEHEDDQDYADNCEQAPEPFHIYYP